MRFVLSAVAALMAGCGSSSVGLPVTSSVAPAPMPVQPVGKDGVSMPKILASKVDNANIAFTIHEPSKMVPGQTYPLILHSHGFGGSRQSARPTAGLLFNLLEAGYGIISIDLRGHGDSGGRIRVLDPDFEGKDLIQILDWADDNLPWLAKVSGNTVMGAIGGSYGGGYQHLIYAIDSKKRLDALAPEITWNDLRYSLANGDVFKSYWGTLLSAGGNAAGNQSKGNMDPFVSQGLAEGLSMGRLPKDKQDFLYRNSLASYCAGENNTGNISKIDALYWQSSRDTLFNLNDSYRNYQCLKAAGGDVRLLVKAPGHDGGGSEQCGKLNKDKSIVAWFNQKLKGQAGVADYIPEFCFHLGDAGDDGVVTTSFPYGGQSFTMPVQSNNLAQEGSPQTVSFELTKIEADGGAVLAGIPTIELKATDPAGLNAAQPVFFVALAKRAAGATSDTVLMGNQAQPMRGYGTFNTELVGVTARLAKGDSLRLVVQMSNALRYSGMGSRTPAAVNVAATVKVPLLSGSLPAPPAQ